AAEAQREAEAARVAERRARAGQLAAESGAARSRDASLGLLLAREAWGTDRIPAARRALYEALFEPVRIDLAAGLGQLRLVDYSSDGRFIVVALPGGGLRLWRV